MTAVRCTAPARGHVPGSQAQRQCPVHGNRAGASSHSTAAAPIAPAPEPASEHRQMVLPNGTVVEGWYRNGRGHREDGPAYVERRPDGLLAEKWHKDGVLHREDGPAWVDRHPDGTVVEGWYKEGKIRREGGPAYVKRSPDGTVVEGWYRNGKLCRDDGPAWVEHRPDGTTKSEAWWLDDKRVEPWEALGRYLLRQGTPELSAEALKQIAKDVPWQRWGELGSDHPLVALWSAVHPTADASAG